LDGESNTVIYNSEEMRTFREVSAISWFSRHTRVNIYDRTTTETYFV